MIAAVVFVTACGGGPTSSSKTTTAAAPPPAAQNDINPMSRDKIKDGGTLTWPLDLMPTNFNYNELDGTDFNGAWVIMSMMPTAFDNAADGTPLWNHAVLASEPTLVTDPKQVVTYEINPKAVWTDGTPITWQDFHWQWKASNGTDKRYQISSANGYEDIESVARGKDDREVIVTFSKKYADWEAIFSPFYPASTNKNPDVFNKGWLGKALATAGPFRMEGINQTTKTITMVRNEKWWGTPAKLDRIVFRVIDPDAQIDALANGEVDLMDLGTDASKMNRARGIAGIDIRTAGGPNFWHLDFNGQSPILQDVQVRRALAMGIDRSVMARALLTPLGMAPTVLNNHIYMENQQGYRDNSGDVGQFNPEKAKQILDAAGWKLQGDVRMKDGTPLNVRLVMAAGAATNRQVSELAQNMLAQIGVKVQIDSVPPTDFFPKYVTTGQFDMTMFAWMGTPYPLSSAKSIYAKPKRTPSGQLDIQQNDARIGSDEIDRLFDQGTAELDRQKARAIGNQIDAAIWQEVHSLTIYQRPQIYPCKKDLANMGALGLAQFPVWTDIGWAK
jgi:peptide/nickel transport system substrate-binding protein